MVLPAEAERILILSCVHKFHEDCLIPWLETCAHCPICRPRVEYPADDEGDPTPSRSTDGRERRHSDGEGRSPGIDFDVDVDVDVDVD